MRTFTLAILSLTLIVFSGCSVQVGSIAGSGISATEKREVGDFNAILVSGTADVVLNVGDEKSVIVTFDDNLMELARTEVVDGELQITTVGSYTAKHTLQVEVTVPSLDKATVTGIGELIATGISGPAMEVEISGVGKAQISGDVKMLNLDVSGTGKAKLVDLVTKSVTVNTSGVASAEVYATESVFADASGSSKIKIHGNPENVKEDSSGVASIELVE